ncbi:MAG: POTRA domain-containing protein [Chitinophagia bacterium]
MRFILFLLFPLQLLSQEVTVRNITITGNKKTKSYIVARELAVQKNQSYTLPEILDGLELSRQNLVNTTLFLETNICFTNWNNDSLDILVDVKERWYYLLFPYLKPADRNWNVWLNDYNLDPDRVNYGLKFHGKNITGRNDRLNAWLINGFTQRMALNYYNPFSDNSLQRGWGFDVSYSRNREMNYGTLRNKQQFFKDPDNFVRRQFYAGGMFSIRKGSINRHYLRFGVQSESISDTILALNNQYLGNDKTSVTYPELRYTFHHYQLNYIPYPTKGHSYEFELLRKGTGGTVDVTQLMFRASRYWELPGKTFFGMAMESHLRVPFDQPFFNTIMLGYNDSYLRGLEYYVVDGVAGGFVRNTIGKEILNFKVKTGLRSKTHGYVPFRIFMKGYGDAGYVYRKNITSDNRLNNKLLYTGGIGIDVVSFYDVVLRFEYSFNQLTERGLFVHKSDGRN